MEGLLPLLASEGGLLRMTLSWADEGDGLEPDAHAWACWLEANGIETVWGVIPEGEPVDDADFMGVKLFRL